MWDNNNDIASTFADPYDDKKFMSKKITHIVPITCHVINLSKQDENELSTFHYEHLTFHQISIIGLVRGILKQANCIKFVIDDMTSKPIHAKLDLEEADLEDEDKQAYLKDIKENQYARIYGAIKLLSGNKFIQIFRIFPLKDLNQVTFHILESMTASISYETKMNRTYFDENMNVVNPLQISKLNAYTNDNLDQLQEQVLFYIKESKAHQGVNINEIFEYLSNVPENKIRTIIEFLVNEGHIYSTQDDDHYKAF